VHHAEGIAYAAAHACDNQELGIMSTSEKIACAAVYLLDNLDSWESFAGSESQPARLYPIPPPLQVRTPCHVFMLHHPAYQTTVLPIPLTGIVVDNAIHIKLLLDALLHQPSVRNGNSTPIRPLQCHAM